MDTDSFDSIMIEAVAREVASRDFYRAAATKVKDPGARAILRELAKDEEEHRVRLEAFRSNPEARLEFEKIPEDSRIGEPEETVTLSFGMSPEDVFRLALKEEQRAMEIYQDLAERCENGEFRKLYLELAAMERGHKRKLETLFAGAALPGQWPE
ncbi:MAG: ferritin family protein [Acidobacteria bacterium]|nr:ferritin family protein [Acidobacteriota bacterium]